MFSLFPLSSFVKAVIPGTCSYDRAFLLLVAFISVYLLSLLIRLRRRQAPNLVGPRDDGLAQAEILDRIEQLRQVPE